MGFLRLSRTNLSVCLALVVAVLAGALNAQLQTISSFPWTPDEATQASYFLVNHGTGPATGGSAWLNGTINGNRRGEGGAGVQAWANRPTASYLNNTTTWLHSPRFDFTGKSGLSLDYYLWVRAQSGNDGMKLQVSTNGGTVWSDVTTSSVAYNGNTNTSNLLASKFGGGNNAWTATSLGGASANLCTLNLNTWAGMSDVRFRWCFVSNGSTTNDGPVLDNFKVVNVTATTTYASGYAAVPQGQTINATVTKTEGQAFTTGMTVSVQGSGVTGSVVSVTNANTCTVSFTATKMADIGLHNYSILLSGNTICQSTMEVFSPQRLVPSREGGSALEPPQNATMGGTSVYLHNGEFRHDLPIVAIPGRMLPLAVGITYRSQFDSMGVLGRGWAASFDVRLTYASNTITLYSGDGRIDIFTLAAGGTSGVGPYVKAGFFAEFTRSQGTLPNDDSDDVFTLTGAHDSTVTFTSPSANDKDTGNVRLFRQNTVKDRYNNAVTFIYNSYGQLDEMRGEMWDALSPTRYKLDFEYGPHGRLTFIRDYADYTGQAGVIGSSYVGQREWEFIYNATTAELTEIKLPKTERYFSDTQGANFRSRVKFTYDGTSNMLEVIDARQANEASPIGWLQNHYNGSGKIDYQDVGRNSAADTTHRNFIVYTSATDVSTVDAEAHRSQFLLNANGTLATLKHYTGTWNSALTQIGAKLRASDPNSFDSAFTYDSEFNTISVTYPRGRVTKFRYDIGNASQRSRGNLLRVHDFKGTVTPDNLPADQQNGVLATFTYTSSANFNLLSTSVSPRAYVLGASYDIVANSPISTDQSAEFTTTYTYNADGTLANVKSPTVSTTVSPDTLNNGQFLQTTFTYNSFKQLETVTDQAGVVTRYDYGSSGFEKGYLLTVKQGFQTASPLTTTYGYNSVGRVITVQDPRGYTYTSYVNQLDQGIRSETPIVGVGVQYYSLAEFDLNGNLEVSKISNIDENGVPQTPSTINTTYAYNILDLATSVTEPIEISTSRTTSFAYDKVYRGTETTLPEGNKSATDYDELNRAIKSYFGFDGTNIAKASALIQSEVYYDLNSNVTRSVDGRGNDSHYTLDAFDRTVKAEDRLVTPNYTEFTYNQASQVTLSVRTGKARNYNWGSDTFSFITGELGRAESRFDNLGRAYFSRVRAKTWDGSNMGYSSYEAPPSGASDGWSTSRVKFTANGLVDFTEGDLRYPTKYAYDSFNRLSRVTDDRDGAGSSDNFDEYGYDANGNVTSVRAVLYDDRNPGSAAKDVTTHFSFDEINRLNSDWITLGTGQTLIRSFKYDSRSQLIESTDRKGQVRRTEYDLLGRVNRTRAYVTMRDIDPTTGYVSYATRTDASKVVYDKNSNVLEAIDATGNRTYSRHDMAGRWVQTQHADGGTPLKTTAGTTHSISQYPGTNFWSATSAYDGNSNLLNLLDENGTLRTWTYDENDQALSETGAAAGGNPFGIEGETGLSYLYDGLYRAAFGETHDGTGTLTSTDSLFNTLGGLEWQRQRVMRAHPSQLALTEQGDVISQFDESGRRFSRRNPGDVTRTTWEFDRKHRPSKTRLEYGDGSGGFLSANVISEYKYLGGGLLHSKHVKYMNQPTFSGTMVVPIISEFERDDLLRLTSVRHWRDDFQLGAGNTRLLGRYDYAYDQNSMMLYEGRWHEQDFNAGVNGASTTPDETDFYFYSSDNQLEKAIYNVTRDDSAGGSEPVNLASINWTNVDANNVTHTDRVIYGRRVTGTRQRVNWYRGSPTRTSALPGSFDESTTGPTQKTHYDNTEDTTKDPDNPAADGAGSRHNYTVIGQTGLTYDNNRNVLADGTREFRYSYNNQLRRVWRKSDGQGASNGLLAKYREDAFGRRVYAESYWELSRRDVMDTRFSVDVNVDADADGNAIIYLNGGITSTVAAPPGQTDQRAQWDSRIRRPITITNEAHYFDFDITVPTGNAGEYLGFIAYDRFELRIFQNKYELWDTAGPTLIGWTSATTVGRHNIGLRAGQGWGVWVDGSQLTLTGGSGSMGLIASPKAKFGSHPNANGFAITLWENLCYLKSYSRASDETIPAPGVPVVDVLKFDGPRPCVIEEVFVNSLIVPKVIDKEDGTSCDVMDDGSFVETQLKPNGREHVADVIQPSQDAATYDSTGNRSTLEEPQPGAAIKIHVDGTGEIEIYGRFDPFAPIETPAYGQPTSSFDFGGNNDVRGIAIGLGSRKKHHTSPPPRNPTSTPVEPSPGVGSEGENQGDGQTQQGAENCLCQESDPSVGTRSVVEEDSSIGAEHDNIGGNWVDRETSTESSIIYSDFAKWISSFAQEIDNYAQMNKSIQAAFLEKMAALAADIRAEMKYWIAARFKTADSSPMAAPTDQRIDELSAMGDLLAEMMGDAGSYFDEYNAASAEHWKKVAAERQKEIDEANRQEKASLGEQAKGFGLWIGEKLLDSLNPVKRIEKIASCLTGGVVHAVDRIGGLCEGDWHRAALGTEGAKYVQGRGEAWGGDFDAYAKAYYSEIANRVTGVRDIGDGIENGDLDQLLRGLETYGNAAATVGAFASWRMARNCFVAGTEVVVLAEGLDPDQANFLLAQGQLPEQLCTTRNIEDVKAGDWVLSRRWQNGNAPLCFSKVEQTFVSTVDVIVELGIGTDESTAGTIRTTMGHPFWVTQTAGGPAPLADPASPHVNERLTYQLKRDGSTKSRDAGWVFATDLAVGDELSAATRGCNDQNPQVWSIEHLPQPGPRVYNFCVGGSHSYFVSATGADAKSSSWVWVHNTNGGDSLAAQRGREAHRKFAEKVKNKPGWQPNPRFVDPKTGKVVIPDATTKRGFPIELKPRTPSGIAAGKRQIAIYERATGKRGRVVYYDPK